jgi:hypothetical protein
MFTGIGTDIAYRDVGLETWSRSRDLSRPFLAVSDLGFDLGHVVLGLDLSRIALAISISKIIQSSQLKGQRFQRKSKD